MGTYSRFLLGIRSQWGKFLLEIEALQFVPGKRVKGVVRKWHSSREVVKGNKPLLVSPHSIPQLLTAIWILALPQIAVADERRSLSEHAEDAKSAIQNWDGRDSQEFEEKKESYDEERNALRNALDQELRALGSRASREDIERVINEFRSRHDEALAAQQEAARVLAENAREEAQPSEVDAFRAALAKECQDRRQARDLYREELVLLADKQEETAALRHDFREDQRARHLEIKDAVKQIREEARSRVLTGNRRIDGS